MTYINLMWLVYQKGQASCSGYASHLSCSMFSGCHADHNSHNKHSVAGVAHVEHDVAADGCDIHD